MAPRLVGFKMSAALFAAARAQLAPSGTLRAAVNLSNKLLVSDQSTPGEPRGVAPDLARAVAASLGVDLELVSYDHPNLLVEDAKQRAFAIGFVGADPARSEFIAFTPPWGELQVTYLCRSGAKFSAVADVDRAGTVVAAKGGSAYHLWLERNLKHASIMTGESQEGTHALSDPRDTLWRTRTLLALADSQQLCALAAQLKRPNAAACFQAVLGRVQTTSGAVVEFNLCAASPALRGV